MPPQGDPVIKQTSELFPRAIRAMIALISSVTLVEHCTCLPKCRHTSENSRQVKGILQASRTREARTDILGPPPRRYPIAMRPDSTPSSTKDDVKPMNDGYRGLFGASYIQSASGLSG